MNKQKVLIIAIFSMIILLIPGCHLYISYCDPEEIKNFEVLLDSPADGVTFQNLNPVTLEWHHEESCRPQKYKVKIIKDYLYYTYPKIHNLDGDETSLSPGIPLEEASMYAWSVEPLIVVDDKVYYGPESETWTFKTFGFCSSSDLDVPVIVEPADGAWFHKSWIHLTWDYPGDCVPYWFKYQVATDPEFNAIILSGVSSSKEMTAYEQFPDCTTLFWRVAATNDVNAKSSYSEPSQFTVVKKDTCWQNHLPSPEMAEISGYVFEDYCAATSPVVPEGVGLTRGCTFGLGYGVHADGEWTKGVQEDITGVQYEELGIPNVTVDLGAGPCPSTGMDSDKTDANGRYSFVVLSPGTYCVSVSQFPFGKLNGIWTLPLTDQLTTQRTIVIPSMVRTGAQNFGWDDMNNPITKIEITDTSFCRAGDKILYHAVAVLEKGQIVQATARNQEATWFKTSVQGVECYVSTATGQPLGDPSELPIYDPVPRPTSTPKVKKDKQCSIYKTQSACIDAGCHWVYGIAGGYCTE